MVQNLKTELKRVCCFDYRKFSTKLRNTARGCFQNDRLQYVMHNVLPVPANCKYSLGVIHLGIGPENQNGARMLLAQLSSVNYCYFQQTGTFQLPRLDSQLSRQLLIAFKLHFDFPDQYKALDHKQRPNTVTFRRAKRRL
jgi:hypothetical protein